MSLNNHDFLEVANISVARVVAEEGTRMLSTAPRLILEQQLLADVLAHAMQGLATALAGLLVLGQIVLDALARQIRRQRLAASLTGLRLVEFRQPGVRQHPGGCLLGACASSNIRTA